MVALRAWLNPRGPVHTKAPRLNPARWAISCAKACPITDGMDHLVARATARSSALWAHCAQRHAYGSIGTSPRHLLRHPTTHTTRRTLCTASLVWYSVLTPMLLNEVQRQQREIAALKAQARELTDLKAQNVRWRHGWSGWRRPQHGRRRWPVA